jgi:hypothetical protein
MMQPIIVWTTYHEAGHAVRAWWLQRDLDGVSIDHSRPGEGRCYGVQCCSHALLLAGAPVNANQLEDDISIDLAGPLAEARYRRVRIQGLFDPTGMQDVALAWETAKLWTQATGSTAESADVLLWLMQQATQRFLQRSKAWRAVEALATALLEHASLEGEEAAQIIAEAYGRRGFPQHWRQPVTWSISIPEMPSPWTSTTW